LKNRERLLARHCAFSSVRIDNKQPEGALTQATAAEHGLAEHREIYLICRVRTFGYSQSGATGRDLHEHARALRRIIAVRLALHDVLRPVSRRGYRLPLVEEEGIGQDDAADGLCARKRHLASAIPVNATAHFLVRGRPVLLLEGVPHEPRGEVVKRHKGAPSDNSVGRIMEFEEEEIAGG
jgi:hypothetical protein